MPIVDEIPINQRAIPIFGKVYQSSNQAQARFPPPFDCAPWLARHSTSAAIRGEQHIEA